MKRIAMFVALFCLMMFAMQHIIHAETIVGGIGEWPPWTQDIGKIDDGKGILVEIFKEAVTRAGHQPRIQLSPHKRRHYIDWGKRIHAELGCIPEWRKEFQDVSVYTIPFVTTRNVILAKKGAMPKVTSKEDFYGKTLGANLGYYYIDGFSEAFDAGKIVRSDTPEGPTLMRMLLKDRLDGAIIDRYEARYWIKTMKLNPDDFEEVYTFSISSNLRMRLHKDKAHLIEALNRSLKEMQHDGTIQRIIDKYTQ